MIYDRSSVVFLLRLRVFDNHSIGFVARTRGALFVSQLLGRDW